MLEDIDKQHNVDAFIFFLVKKVTNIFIYYVIYAKLFCKIDLLFRNINALYIPEPQLGEMVNKVSVSTSKINDPKIFSIWKKLSDNTSDLITS